MITAMTRGLIALGAVAGAVTAVAYAQTSTTPSPYKAGEIVNLDAYGNQVLIVSCGMKNNVSQCAVRQGTNGDFGNGVGDMWVMDILKKDNALRAAKGQPPRTAAAGAQPPAAVAARPAVTAAPPAPTAGAQTGAATGRRCSPATPYVGAIPASRAPSPSLFQQLIANKFVSDATPAYPRKVDFLSFVVGPQVTNRVGQTAQGANRVTNGAPAGVQMTTIKTSFTVCKEEWSGKTRYDSTYFCWKAGGEWACGVSESKVTNLR